MVWTFGKYGHVAILRGYQQDTTSEILSSYPQDATGTIVAVFDEQNAGKMIDDPITDRFGLVTRRQLPASNFNRNSLEFKGLILPRPVRPKLSIGTDSKTFTIGTDATMPVVTATVSSIPPVDLSGTTFDWTATIRFPMKLATNAKPTDKNGKELGPDDLITGPDTFAKHVVQGPKVTFSGTDWQGMVRGGQLTLTATATIRGESVTATLDGLSIKGQNPSKDAVRSYINSQPVPSWYPAGATYTYNQVLNKLASVESGGALQQFISDGTPLFNAPAKGAEPDGGAGVMQLTPPSPEETWNWKKNVDDGATTFRNKLVDASAYSSILQDYVNSTDFTVVLARINVTRSRTDQIKHIVVPGYGNPDWLVRDAIRGYNGLGGWDIRHLTTKKGAKVGLHQYTIVAKDGKPDDGSRLDVSGFFDRNTGTLTATWREVLPSERPTNGSYVDAVWKR
jgi:hypothetical protein